MPLGSLYVYYFTGSFFITERYGLADGHTINGLRGSKSALFCGSAKNIIDLLVCFLYHAQNTAFLYLIDVK